jgi:hypothetical protein
MTDNVVSRRSYQKPTITKGVILGAIVAGGSVTLSDRRLKRDVTLVARRADGINLYRYRYLLGEQRFVGVMAQEVKAIRPDAVVSNPDGFLAVDYARLGLRLEAVAA